jgi:hypothetical protein
MALLTTQPILITGITPSLAAASGGGDSVVPSETTFVRCKNGGGSPITLTVVIPGTEHGQAKPDVPVSIAAGAEATIGPLTADMRNLSTGHVDLTYSGVTTVTIGAFLI